MVSGLHSDSDDSAHIEDDELIQSARRGVVVQRHQDVISEMEGTLTNNVVAGDTEHSRLKKMLEQLDSPEVTDRRDRILRRIAQLTDENLALQQALIEELCVMKDESDAQIAGLQLVCVACYRQIHSVAANAGSRPELKTLRELPAIMVAKACLEPGHSTGLRQALADATRPDIVERHRDLLEDMELSITGNLVTGAADNPRLKRMLQELEAESEQQRIEQTIRTIAEHPRLSQMSLKEALIEETCMLRERGVEVATLQLHIIGVYRRLRDYMSEQHGLIPDLDDLRTLQGVRVQRLLNPKPITFGDTSMGDALVLTERQVEHALSDIKNMSMAKGGDKDWHEANGNPPLPRDVEEPLRELPPDERQAKREQLIKYRIRSHFYRSVFLNYFDRDTLGDEEIDAHQTILAWLQGMRDTPHLYPYMQGQTNEQKLFRLSRLLNKIVQLNELYQRISRALAEPGLGPRLEPLNNRERVSMLAKAKFPPAKLDGNFAVQTMLCPFGVFARWIQEQVAEDNLVLPPDA